MCSPGSDEVQQVLPALADLAELVLDLGSLAVVAGPGQALPHHLQLLLVLLGHANLLLVVLEAGRDRERERERGEGEARGRGMAVWGRGTLGGGW